MIHLESVVFERLCLTLLHSIWQVAALALAAWGIGRCLCRRRDDVSYVVHTITLVLGLSALPITYGYLASSGMVSVAETEQVADGLVAVPPTVVSSTLPLPTDIDVVPDAGFEAAISSHSAPPVSQSNVASQFDADDSVASAFVWQSIVPWLTVAYAIGVAFMLARLGWSAIVLERLRVSAEPISDGPVYESLVRLCRRWSFRTAPVLARTKRVFVPKVVGLFKPTILLPSSAMTGLSIDDLELLLAHELAHVRRHDLWINLLQRLGEAILFFNPALWWLSRRISTLREYCCDDRACAVISDASEPQLRYATALLNVVELQTTSRSAGIAAIAASGRSPSELRRRVARLFGENMGESIRLSRGGVAIVLGAAALLFIAPNFTDTWADDRPNPPQQAETDDGLAEEQPTKEQPTKEQPKEQSPKEQGPVLCGTITSSAGDPLVGVTVQLYGGIATRWRGQSARTDAKGRYRFEPMTTGAYMRDDQDQANRFVGLKLEHPSYVVADGKSWRDLTIPIDPEHVETLDLQMIRGGKVSGVVIDHTTEKVIPKLPLRIHNGHRKDRDGNHFLVYATTDDQGKFESKTLFPGDYVIDINDGDYRGGTGYPQIGFATVTAGETIEVRMTDSPLPERLDPFQIKGTAFGVDGKRMTYGSIGVRLVEGGEVRARGGGIDGRPVFGLRFGPVKRIPVTAKSPFGIGTQEIELVGHNSRYGYTLASRKPSQPIRITDNPDRSQDEPGYLYLRPNEPVEFEMVFQKDKTQADSARTTSDEANRDQMLVRIVDESGKPLAGAKMFANTLRPPNVEGDRIGKLHLVTNEKGIVTLPINRQTDTVKLWAGKEGYVSEFVWLQDPEDPDGGELPSTFEFRLATGARIGGVVVNKDGLPLANVAVRVRVDRVTAGTVIEGEPRVDTWLSNGNTRGDLVTDGEGRWELTNAPGPDGPIDYRFDLKLAHPDFTGDQKWGELQRQQGITTEMLRAGSAKLVMAAGTHVEGRVTGPNGEPITKGWVVWHDEPYFTDGVWEAELDDRGVFKTPSLPLGEHPITIIAPGYAAQRRVVSVAPGMESQDFELKLGKQLEIQFQDKTGKPIPNAGVYLGSYSNSSTWNGSNALHSQGSPGVDYGVPRRANQDGVYVWDWAPEEPVTYNVGAKGYAGQTIALVAKSEPHVITLADARVAFGKVTDAKTGEPIKKFQVMPVIVFRPNFFTTRFADVKQGVDGEFTLPLTGSADPQVRYRVRFEAEGYRSVVSEASFGPQDGRSELNIQLEPSAARKGRVLNAEGKPVANALVLEGTPTWVPTIYNSTPDAYGESLIRTDGDGRFELNATTEAVLVRVLHDEGVAEKQFAPMDASIGELQLQPWAKLSGRLLQNGKPIGNQRIYFNRLVQRGLGEARFQGNAQTLTAADGTFSFDRLPPGEGNIRVDLGPWRDSPLTSAKGLPIVLQPGETRQLTLGGEGSLITGSVIATGRDDVPLNRNWSLNYLVRRSPSLPVLPAGFPKLSFDPSGPLQNSWLLDPNFQSFLATREHHFVKLTPDGNLRVTGVSPGDYDLVLRLYEQPAGCLVETVGEKIVAVRVDGDGTIDLGEIEVPCRAGPRSGSDMRAYEFVDSTGRKRSIQDMSGRYVLLHVWATWCGPCIVQMPEIAATREQLDGKPITLIGLNIDADRERARDMATRLGWSWAHNFLGDDSDVARQMAISSIPAYYLIGPDGRLITSDSDWKRIQETITETLAASSPR